MLANELIIDHRSSGNLTSNIGTEWRLVANTVMGRVSSGNVTFDSHNDRNCLRMRGNVSTKNNGGFVQMSLSLFDSGVFDASDYDGIEFEVSGNSESYNVHLRTTWLWFPWRSYRASFTATSDWQTVRIPFSKLEAYKTSQAFRQNKLKRVGLLGIGREFNADHCLAAIGFCSR